MKKITKVILKTANNTKNIASSIDLRDREDRRMVFVITFLFILSIFMILAGRLYAVTPPGTVITQSATSEWYYSDMGHQDAVSDTVMIVIDSLSQITIIISPNDSVLCPGDTAEFRVFIENSGNVDLNGVSIAEILLPDMVSSYNAFYDTFSIGSYDSFDVQRYISLNDRAGSYITDSVSIMTSDSIYFNASSSIRVCELDSLYIVKDASTDIFIPIIDTLMYSIYIENVSNTDSLYAEVTDFIPPLFNITSAKDARYFALDTFDNVHNFARWTGDIPFQDVDTLELWGYFDSSGCNNNQVNTVQARYSTGQSDASDTLFLRCTPQFELEYAVNLAEANSFDSLLYTLTVRSLNEDTIRGITIIDSLTDNATYLSSTSGTYDPIENFIIWEGITLAPDEEIEYTVATQVNDLAFGFYLLESCAYLYWQLEDSNAFDIDSAYLMNDVCAQTMVINDFIELNKECLQQEAGVGDILIYYIEVENVSENDSVQSMRIHDILPYGFDYLSGTALWNGRKIDNPRVSGNEVVFEIGGLNTQRTGVLIYQTVAGMGADDGDGRNSAFADVILPGNYAFQTDTVSDWIEVSGGLFRGEEFIIGKVFFDDDNNGYQSPGEEGAPEVALFTENGIKVITDKNGKFSIPQIKAGKHVLRIDQTTLPVKTKPTVTKAANALDPYSQFVDVPQAGLAKVTFALERGIPSISKSAYLKPGFVVRADIAPKNLEFIPDSSYESEKTVGTFYFDKGHALTPVLRKEIDRILPELKKVHNTQIMVNGYTDKTPVRPKEKGGTYASNMELSQLRADAVLSYIKSTGIMPKSIIAKGYGDTKAKYAENKRDRRVDIIVSGSKGSGARAQEDSPIVSIGTNFFTNTEIPVNYVDIEYEFIGFDYIPGSATFDGNNIADSVSNGSLLKLRLNNFSEASVKKVLLSTKLLDDVVYHQTPRVIAYGTVVFSNGTRESFEASATITPFTAGDSLGLPSNDNDYPQSIYLGELTPEFGKKIEEFETIDYSEKVIFRLKVNIPSTKTGKTIEISDIIPDNTEYLPLTSRINNKDIEPEIDGNKLKWSYTTIDGETNVFIDYQCKTTSNITWKIDPTSSRVEYK